MTALLRVAGLRIRFGGLVAVNGIDLEINRGERLGLIGPNGAGKTTALRLIFGSLRPLEGRIAFDGADITALPVHRRVAAGIGLTHQIVKPFRGMSVLENVAVAAGWSTTRSPLRALFRVSRAAERHDALDLLERVGLASERDKLPGALSVGQLKRLEVARALAVKPKLLLLDEPLAGLNSSEASRLADIVVELNEAGLTVALVEHNLGEVLRIATRLVVMDAGKIIADGTPADIIADPLVREAYVGTKADDAAA